MKRVPKILIADDELDLQITLQHSLADEGYQVLTAGNGLEALSLVYKHSPSLLILDINMPELTGHEICRRLRRDVRFAAIPIIFLTVESRVEDRVTGLDNGCDDYMIKPFDLRELKARVRALLRRSKAVPVAPYPSQLEVGPLVLDGKLHAVHHNGRTVELTPIEYSLLHHLMVKSGEVVPVEELAEAVWGFGHAASSANLVRWHMSNLRHKLEPDPSRPRIIRTHSHFGYMLSADDKAVTP